MAPGNTTAGFLNWSAPIAPVYVAPPTPPYVSPPTPSIVGSISPVSGYPGQVVTATATLGSYTDSGKAVDGFGTVVPFTSSGSGTYKIPLTAKIGQVVDVTFYAVNDEYPNFKCNTVSSICSKSNIFIGLSYPDNSCANRIHKYFCY